jgi:hypothetical protein
VGTPPRSPIVWPAYLVAGVCFALAVALSLINLSLAEQLKSAQAEIGVSQKHASILTRDLTDERATLEDVMDSGAERFDVPNGQVVRVRGRLYLSLHDLAQAPHGKVYETWFAPRGTTNALQPSLTFVPDAHGVAVIALPMDAKNVVAVALSLEPEGGSKTPGDALLWTKPLE